MIRDNKQYQEYLKELQDLRNKKNINPLDQTRILFLEAEIKDYENMIAFGD